jgi:hypothetical protein
LLLKKETRDKEVGLRAVGGYISGGTPTGNARVDNINSGRNEECARQQQVVNNGGWIVNPVKV